MRGRWSACRAKGQTDRRCIGQGGRPARRVPRLAEHVRTSLKSATSSDVRGVLRETRSTAGGTPTLTETCHSALTAVAGHGSKRMADKYFTNFAPVPDMARTRGA